MTTTIFRRPRLVIFAALAVLAAVLAAPAGAALTPVDVSGPVDGVGPGVAATPSANIIIGTSITVDAENLPTGTEATDVWVDDGNFSDDLPTPGGEVGSYGGSVTVALCGNADAAGSSLGLAFDPLLHCDGGDARSSTFLVTTTATLGSISVAVPTRAGQGFFDFDADGDPGTPPTSEPDSIGLAGATCVAGAGPCQFYVTDGANFSGLVGFDLVASPTIALDSITGQLAGAQAARGGDELLVSGSGWDPASALSAALCDPADPTSCDPSSSTALLTIDGTGLLGGTVPIDPLSTTGSRVLKVTQTSNGGEALLPILILAARVITIDPTTGGVGTLVTIDGSGFDPLQSVTVTGSDGVNPTSDAGSAAVDSVGTLTGSILVQSSATVSIVVTEDDAPTTDGASAPFEFTIQEQVGQVVINGSALTLTQAGGQVAMSPVALNGLTQQSTGAIQTVTLSDARGTLTGWSVTATATDWVDTAEPVPTSPAPNHSIPAGNLTWIPTCGPATGSTADPAEVIAGGVATLDPTNAATLCTAAPGGGGGAWEADAVLVLNVPASIAAGTYEATLTIVAS